MKDFTLITVNQRPVMRSINFETSAHKLSKRLSNDLKTSSPPRKIIIPKRTTMCIKSFFLFGIFIAKEENNTTITPKIEGIYEVNESLPLIKDIINPQDTRKTP